MCLLSSFVFRHLWAGQKLCPLLPLHPPSLGCPFWYQISSHGVFDSSSHVAFESSSHVVFESSSILSLTISVLLHVMSVVPTAYLPKIKIYILAVFLYIELIMFLLYYIFVLNINFT